MCGFNGVIGNLTEGKINEVKSNSSLIQHRGPDEHTNLYKKDTYIEFYRLSIVDIENGSQPQTDKDDNYTVFFNGEIYNFLHLKNELISKGIEFATNSDTEVLLNVLNIFGIEGIKKLNGMFSICLIDNKSEKTYLIRDQFGIKPLYYVLDEDTVRFSSELKTLETKSNKVFEKSLGDYLGYQFYLDDKTLNKNINTVNPGNYIEVDNKTGKIKIIEYFKVEFLSSKEPKKSLNDLENVINESVKRQTYADVEVGSHLSGGIDSSLITAIASKYVPDLKTFHGYFPDSDSKYSEIEYAREVASHLQLKLYEIEITHTDFINNFSKLMFSLDYPIVGPGVFPQYMVNKFAAKHVKVLLGGQGGDEIFAGYARYLIVYLEQVLLGSINESQSNQHLVNLNTVSNALPSLKEYIPLIQKMWSSDLFTNPANRYEQILQRSIPKQWLSESSHKLINTSRVNFQNKMDNIKEDSLINKMLHFDVKYILPGLLQVEDRVSMAHSIESRVPYLDQDVFNTAVNLEPQLKFGKGVLKSPLKEIAKKYLPERVALRKEKMGFPVPFNDWLKIPEFKDYVFDTILLSSFANSKYFELKEFEKDLLSFENFDRSIWAILCLSEWSNKSSFFDDN